MTGNVWEWTLSQYVDYPYENDARNHPEGSHMRALRGGSWYNLSRPARVSYRFRVHPASFDLSAGFRLVLAPVLQGVGF